MTSRTESKGEGKGSTFFVKLPAAGSPRALTPGTQLAIGIKAGEAGQSPYEASAEAREVGESESGKA